MSFMNASIHVLHLLMHLQSLGWCPAYSRKPINKHVGKMNEQSPTGMMLYSNNAKIIFAFCFIYYEAFLLQLPRTNFSVILGSGQQNVEVFH